MLSAEGESSGVSPPTGAITPGPDTQAPIDVVNVRNQKARTPTDRIEDRADLHINEIQAERDRLLKEIDDLRDESRDLRSLIARQADWLARLETSYEFTITFNWFSFALVSLGGGAVSYASFGPGGRWIDPIALATLGFLLILIGVLVQAYTAYQGGKLLMPVSRPIRASTRSTTPTPSA